ncbi:hypothetical protein THERMOT_1067 [Bathymodiolus thermophilus thioautotrophic gill symbiont]|uniref:Uncharacterized protein n=1 Tax=Bathymodiolus thermophilus thioautotrophic gill symbiont TaxID=2360 RepID=A0A8H8XC06_9GAMM|nr:hypothetical protein THERMOS_367 [Bathymodiolus thermophilus thioautotrophic gill symbiont]CAB5499540.1 hypothetical protein THERMOT_1067 [Bathymodiolus thermophilus thioautotrophic gill symbiont]
MNYLLSSAWSTLNFANRLYLCKGYIKIESIKADKGIILRNLFNR